MSQDDCAVIDTGRVEVVGPPAGQGRARRPCLALCKTVSLLAVQQF